MQQMLIDYYKAIESSSGQMLEAARAEDWDTVVRFEGVCAVLIEQLRERARSEALSEEAKREKSKIMLRILKNDAQIRQLVEPCLEHVDHHLSQRRVLH